MMVYRHGVQHKVCFNWKGAFIWVFQILLIVALAGWVR